MIRHHTVILCPTKMTLGLNGLMLDCFTDIRMKLGLPTRSVQQSRLMLTTAKWICTEQELNWRLFFDFSLTVKAAPHECVIRTGQL